MLPDTVQTELNRQACVWAYAQQGLVYGVSQPTPAQQAAINRLAATRYEQLKQDWFAHSHKVK